MRFLFALLLINCFQFAFAEEPAQAPQPAQEKALSPPPVSKPGIEAHVIQVFRDTKKVVADFPPSTAHDSSFAPDRLIFTNAKGEACEGTVSQIIEFHAYVDFSNCSIFDEIKSGARLAPSIFDAHAEPHPNQPQPPPPVIYEPQPPPPSFHEAWFYEHPEDPESPWRHVRFGVTVGYDTSDQIYFNDATFYSGGTTSTGSEKFNINTAPEIAATVIYARENHWGFLGNYVYQGRRDIRNARTYLDDGTVIDTSYTVRPQIQMSVLELNALYRWRFLYFPIGLNYSWVSLRSDDDASHWDNSVGAQFGVGFIVGDHWHFEVLDRFIGGSLHIDNGGTTYSLGAGNLEGIVFRAGIVF